MFRMLVLYHTQAESTQELLRNILEGINQLDLAFHPTDKGINDILRLPRLRDADLVLIHPRNPTVRLLHEPEIPVIVFSSDYESLPPAWLGHGVLRISTRLLAANLGQLVAPMISRRMEARSEQPVEVFREIAFSRIHEQIVDRSDGIAPTPSALPWLRSDETTPLPVEVEAMVAKEESRHREANTRGVRILASLIWEAGIIDDDMRCVLDPELQRAGLSSLDDIQKIPLPLADGLKSAKPGVWPMARILLVDDQHRRGWSTLLSLMIQGSSEHVMEPVTEFPKCMFSERNDAAPVLMAIPHLGAAYDSPLDAMREASPRDRALLPFDLAFIDYRLLPEEDEPAFDSKVKSGARLIDAIREFDPSLPIVVFTASSKAHTLQTTTSDARLYYQKPGRDIRASDQEGLSRLIRTIEATKGLSWTRLAHLCRCRASSSFKLIDPKDPKAAAKQGIFSEMMTAFEEPWKKLGSIESYVEALGVVCHFAGLPEYKDPDGKYVFLKDQSRYSGELFQMLLHLRNTHAHNKIELLAHPTYLALAALCRADMSMLAIDIDNGMEASFLLRNQPEDIQNIDYSQVSAWLREIIFSRALEPALVKCFDDSRGFFGIKEPGNRWQKSYRDLFMWHFSEYMKALAIKDAPLEALIKVGGSDSEQRKKQLKAWADSWLVDDLLPGFASGLTVAVDNKMPNRHLVAAAGLAGRFLRLSKTANVSQGRKQSSPLIAQVSFTCGCLAIMDALRLHKGAK
jgi:CheY-like chemotaxis protein